MLTDSATARVNRLGGNHFRTALYQGTSLLVPKAAAERSGLQPVQGPLKPFLL